MCGFVYITANGEDRALYPEAEGIIVLTVGLLIAFKFKKTAVNCFIIPFTSTALIT